MAFLSEADEDSEEDDILPALDTAIESCVSSLRPPIAFVRAEKDANTINKLHEWKAHAERHLHELSAVIQRHRELSNEHRARVIAMVAVFDGDDDFTTVLSRDSAKDILKHVTPSFGQQPPKRAFNEWQSVLQRVLEQHIKPYFVANSHPQISLESGRKLPRQAGGNAGAMDFFEDQTWKRQGMGCWNVLRWCVSHMEGDDTVNLWPLLVPPIMTMMDDFEAPYRIRAINIVSDLLQRIDASLLKRTGIDTLLFSSLESSYTQLSSPDTSALLPASVICCLSLIDLVYPDDIQARFDKLCDMASKAVIGAWSFSGSEVKTMEASVEVLVPIVRSLRLGSSRYLKALIPQLTDMLYTKPFVPPARRLQLLSAECLVVVIQECCPRIPMWKGRIINGLLRGWVEITDHELKEEDIPMLKEAYKRVWEELAVTCPSVREVEEPELRQVDGPMFADLFTSNLKQ